MKLVKLLLLSIFISSVLTLRGNAVNQLFSEKGWNSQYTIDNIKIMKGEQSILDHEDVKINFNARVFESQPKDFIDKTARYQEGNTHWCWDVRKMDGYDLLKLGKLAISFESTFYCFPLRRIKDAVCSLEGFLHRIIKWKQNIFTFKYKARDNEEYIISIEMNDNFPTQMCTSFSVLVNNRAKEQREKYNNVVKSILENEKQLMVTEKNSDSLEKSKDSSDLSQLLSVKDEILRLNELDNIILHQPTQKNKDIIVGLKKAFDDYSKLLKKLEGIKKSYQEIKPNLADYIGKFNNDKDELVALLQELKNISYVKATNAAIDSLSKIVVESTINTFDGKAFSELEKQIN